MLLSACGGGSNNGPSASTDPAPSFNDPGTYSCEGCPDSTSTLTEFLVQTAETSVLLSGQVSGAIGDGQYFVSSDTGQSSSGTIPTDDNGSFDLTLGLSCGSQIVKCIWSNELGQYVLVTEVDRDCDTPTTVVDNNPDDNTTDDRAPAYCFEAPFSGLAGTYQGTVVFEDAYFKCEHEISLTVDPLFEEDPSNFLCERTGEIKISSRTISEDTNFACGNYSEAVEVPITMNASYISSNVEFDLQQGDWIRTADFAYPVETLAGTPGVPEIQPIGTGGTKPPPHLGGWNFNQDGTVTHSNENVYTGSLSR